MKRAFKQVDVFTDTLGMGNPVAVVLEADGLSSGEMQQFATWTNLSETTFVLTPTEPGADYWVRIFTPVEELRFAGHPTVGTCHAWLESGGVPAVEGQIVQQCGAGLVTLRPIDGRLAFETPPRFRSGPVDSDVVDSVVADLGLDPSAVFAPAWGGNGPPGGGVLVNDVEVLRSLNPNWTRLDRMAGVAALLDPAGPADPAVEVRAFFYAGGTREDPVTGSLNGAVAQWLVGNGTLVAPYVSSQGTSMGRDGKVFVSPGEGDALWVGGDAVTGIDGQVEL